MKKLLILLMVSVPLTCWAVDSPDAPQRAELVVRGDALLQVAADQVRFSVGVVSEDRTAGAALEQNSRAMRQVEKALIRAGLNKGEYSTGQFRLQPRWSSRPRSAPRDWRPEIVGYTVRNSLNIKTARLSLIGALIEAARQAGADEIGQLRFGLSDPRKYRQQAIAEAVAHGREDAENAAAAAGMRLGAIRQLTIGPQDGPPVRPLPGAAMVRSMSAEAAPPIIAPDDLQVRAAVTLTFALLPKVGTVRSGQ